MRKVLFILLLLLSQLGIAQTKKTWKSEKVRSGFYLGLGLQSTDNYNINNKLKAAQLPQIDRNLPDFILGVNMVGPKFSGDIEISTAYSNIKLTNIKNEYINTTARLRFHRNISKKDNALFTSGVNIAFAGNAVNVFGQNNIIDMNNLSNASNVKHISLRNQMFYIGPSIAFTAFRKATFPLRMNIGYEIGLSRGRWRSDFSAISNTVGEFGKNRLIVSLNLM